MRTKYPQKYWISFQIHLPSSLGKKHICYLIPGPNGELTSGKRRLNWVWYVNALVQGDILKTVMTDKNGILREFSVPQGMLNEDVVKKQKTVAEDVLPEFSTDDICNKRAFIQAIYDLSVSKMAFDRARLIGDTSFVGRPHTAEGTSKAV